jgi:hypothetical protein
MLPDASSSFSQEFEGSVVVTSHDRRLLREVCQVSQLQEPLASRDLECDTVKLFIFALLFRLCVPSCAK